MESSFDRAQEARRRAILPDARATQHSAKHVEQSARRAARLDAVVGSVAAAGRGPPPAGRLTRSVPREPVRAVECPLKVQLTWAAEPVERQAGRAADFPGRIAQPVGEQG